MSIPGACPVRFGAMRRILAPLWLALLASALVWPQLDQRTLGVPETGPRVERSAPDVALPAHRTSATSHLATSPAGPRGTASRQGGGVPSPALAGADTPPLALGLPHRVSLVERPEPRAAPQRHFPRFPTGPPAARFTL